MSVDATLRMIIEDFVDNRYMFTAYDVSRAACSNGVDERHRDLRDNVHFLIADIINNTDYTRTLVDLPNVDISPWLYHPSGARISDYAGTPIQADDIQVIGYTIDDDEDNTETKDDSTETNDKQTLGGWWRKIVGRSGDDE